MSDITDIMIQKKKMDEFLSKYGSNYDTRELEYIKRNWQSSLSSQYKVDILRQIYSELGLIPDEKNIYLGFMKILEENFDINKDIIEVGGGRYPAFAKMLALKQKSGTVTVYDPRLVTTTSSIPNMKLKKETFTKKTPIGKTQMIVAFMPCEAAEPALYSAGENGIDFLIALCEGGPHGDEFDYFESEEEWIGSMLYTARRLTEQHGLGEVQVADLKEYGDNYPVIYNKRKKL